ncbi:MAG: hypothetical protein HYY06_22050 [Deltaproteobacteria bacterium]|nr:hypothetical protein [Deltaproteobacteria bacterium]
MGARKKKKKKALAAPGKGHGSSPKKKPKRPGAEARGRAARPKRKGPARPKKKGHAARTTKARRAPARKGHAARKTKARRARPKKASRTTALRPTRPKHLGRAGRGSPSPQRVTPLTDDAPPEQLDEFGSPIRPSRVITSRPRPPLRQVDPMGAGLDTARTLEPWEVDVDDLAQMIAARAAEEMSSFGERPQIASSEALASMVDAARRVGWIPDPRPSGSSLPDARLRFVHPACKYLDGKLVRDVSLSIHPPTGRASLTLEGGDRARIVSWVIAEDEDLPVQVGRILEDPARLARIEFASGRELLARLDELDRLAVTRLGRLARSGTDGALGDQLLEYVRGFAALNASYGLPGTVDAIWSRFGAREGSVLEKLELDDATRQRLCDVFDSAIDGCQTAAASGSPAASPGEC